MTPRKTKRRKADRWGGRLAIIVPVVIFIVTFGWSVYANLDTKLDKKVDREEYYNDVILYISSLAVQLNNLEDKLSAMNTKIAVLKDREERDHKHDGHNTR